MPADIDVTNASRVGEQLLSALVPGVSAVIVDLTGTAFCDCAGVRSLLLAHSKAAAGDIPFLLAVSPGGVLRILELVGVLHVLRIYSDWPSRRRGNCGRGVDDSLGYANESY